MKALSASSEVGQPRNVLYSVNVIFLYVYPSFVRASIANSNFKSRNSCGGAVQTAFAEKKIEREGRERKTKNPVKIQRADVKTKFKNYHRGLSSGLIENGLTFLSIRHSFGVVSIFLCIYLREFRVAVTQLQPRYVRAHATVSSFTY